MTSATRIYPLRRREPRTDRHAAADFADTGAGVQIAHPQFGGCGCSLGRIECNCQEACQQSERSYVRKPGWAARLVHFFRRK